MTVLSGEEADAERELASLAEELRRLHAAIDREVARVEKQHAGRLQCARGCAACCLDDLTISSLEAELLRTRHAELLATQPPHPAGACAFLDAEGACRAYESRPYRCRTQGVPLRWLDERSDAQGGLEVVELRDICPLNEEGEPLEELPESACFTLGPAEGRLADLAARADAVLQRLGRRPGRVALRDLFLEGRAPR